MKRSIINPATGEVVREVLDSTKDQVDQAIVDSLTAFKTWSNFTPGERSKKKIGRAHV